MLRRFCLCLSLLIISFHANADVPDRTASFASPIGELVSVKLLEHCGMDVAWQKLLFVKADEKINRMLIHDKYLFLFTDQNYLYCVDRFKGKIVFSQEIGGLLQVSADGGEPTTITNLDFERG